MIHSLRVLGARAISCNWSHTVNFDVSKQIISLVCFSVFSKKMFSEVSPFFMAITEIKGVLIGCKFFCVKIFTSFCCCYF